MVDRQSPHPSFPMSTSSAKTTLLSVQSIATFGALAYVLSRRWESERSDEGDPFEAMVGSLAPASVVLSMLPGVAFALSFFFFQRQIVQRMKEVGAESIMPLVMASAVGLIVNEVILVYHGEFARFRYGYVSGILLGSVLASKML